MTKPLQNDDLAKLLLRLAVGGLMLFHGLSKVADGIAPLRGMLAAKGLPEDLALGVYVGEIVAPILILLGFLARPAGLIVAFNMAMSMYLAFGMSTFAIGEHGGLATELNWLYLIGGLAIFLAGSGRYSVGRSEGRWS